MECEQTIIHKDVIKQVKKNLVKENTLINVSEFFKMFGDSTRIKIIGALINSEMCVCDIAYLLNMTHSSISHQLRILKQAKIVKYRKEGKIVYYSINDKHIEQIFNKGVEHIEE